MQPVSTQLTEIDIRRADWQHPADQQAVLELLDRYARDPLGQGGPLSDAVRQRLIPGLRAQPGTVVLLAWRDSQPGGLAVCFEGFSTFHARPLLNLHDLIVVPELRGRGVGRALLQAVEAEAVRRGCCKLTLEVRADNLRARRLYRTMGFDSGESAPEMSFWTKPLFSKRLGEETVGENA